MRIKLRERYFTLLRCRLPQGVDGNCHLEDRTIKVRKNLRGERELEVLIHEMLHGCYWDLDEEAIESSARNIARVLTRLGYRRQDS
jgi:hypothetical protein